MADAPEAGDSDAPEAAEGDASEAEETTAPGVADGVAVDRGQVVRTLAATVASLGVLAAVVAIVGVDAVASAASRADSALLAVVVAAELVAMALFGTGLWTTLRTLGHPVSPDRAVAAFFATTFVSNATPFGRAGGNPVSGLVVAWTARSRYETGLAGIVAVHTVYNLVGVALGVAGAALLALQTPLRGGLGRGAALATGAIVGMVAGLALLWQVREPIADAAASGLAGAATWLGRRLPRADLDPDDLRDRVAGFVADLEAFVGDRRTAAAVVSAGTAGQVAVVGALWVALLAVGARVPFPLVMAVVPLSWVAAAGPTPGGLAGTELVLVAGLAVTTPVPAARLTAAVLLYRAATFWLPTVVGGGTTAGIALSR